MRQNLPVTAIEYPLADGKYIVSKTDLKGRITYVNPYFIEASGFAEHELLGAPHNLVRHPDMPAEVFDDLWRTLRAGLPWSGLVKNRRKDGGYYWVEANATPLQEGGVVTGYLSVRRKPVRAEVEQAERVYRGIREGNPQRLSLRQGQVVRAGLAGLASRVLGSSLRWRIAGALMAIAMLFAAIGVAGLALLDGPLGALFACAGALGVLVIALLEFTVRHSVGIPMQKAIEAARAIAGGDLSREIATDRRDDVGQMLRAMQQMNMNLVAMLGDVRGNVDTMAAATRDIAAGNVDLSGRTEGQASNLEETASSMEQLALAVRQNAGNAQVASQLVGQATAVAVRGGEAVARVGATMGEISKAGKRIEDIVGLIDGIAFQTNLLALNASVEAAKAGPQGRGFAVVAGEVRALAQRSAAAAKEIKLLIDDTVRRLEEGDRQVADAGATMAGIVASVRQVEGIMADMAGASAEQSAGIDQINHAVADMDRNTQQNAAMVEQSAEAANSLREQAERLRAAIDVFKLGAPAGLAAVRGGRRGSGNHGAIPALFFKPH
ncbi:methyl-accepting chemotaxis protein [Pseudoduganella namucuonensis]|uniref:Methyl-accepting chemotaxis sensory transducer with Pas/Pac sensor n=1 Tax=Pseudoduganella namucuonensis TaxID=1035707 RepID=A0A1I7LMX7_9BURK|nr:PAS domain-containing methyl-accepting chemotaxis protein [Pseudoduganella namucuonensis]SFV11024.1 methyl-accepting chemotaxis sensory transducer with Pas/Pac sensor [Pseudoduganella namucuonensis]